MSSPCSAESVPAMHRRAMMAGLAVLASAGGARAAEAPADEKKVYLDYTQKQLDDAYNQAIYAPNARQLLARYTANSADLVARIGPPREIAYGKRPMERILYYPAKRRGAPLFLFVHGGAWHAGQASQYLFPAEMFLDHGISYAAMDFDGVEATDGQLAPIVDQVCRAALFCARNPGRFGAAPRRLVLGAHSSGAHLAGVALTTDWRGLYGSSPDLFASALLISGMYDMRGPRLSSRGGYVHFDDASEDALSAQRHIDRLHTPLLLMTGTRETPEFQRQSRDFAAAVTAAGKRAELRIGREYNHFEMMESLANPYAIAGRGALELCRAG